MNSNCIAATFALAASTAIGNSAFAQFSQDTDFIACSEISNDKDRLNCFDNAADQALRSKPLGKSTISSSNTEPNNSVARVNDTLAIKPTAQTDSSSNFGAEDIAAEREKRAESQLKKIEGRTSKVRTNKLGKVTVTLENGQVWKQLNSDGRKIRLRNDKNPYTVEIKRTSFGFTMKVDGSKRTIRVKRIK